ILAAFHTTSLWSFPANLILFPLVPAIMAASGATALAGAIWHPAAVVLAPIAYALLKFMVLIVLLCSRLPGSQIEIGWFDRWWAVGMYLLFGVAVWTAKWWRQPVGSRASAVIVSLRIRLRLVAGAQARSLQTRSRQVHNPAPFRLRTVGLAALATGGIALALVAAARSVSGTLRVTYLDVGPGSAILVQSGSQRLLVDAGPPGDATVRALDRVLPPWQRSVNLAVVTDPAAGHTGGLTAVLRRYGVGAIVDATQPAPAGPGPGPGTSDWQKALAAAEVLQVPRAPVLYFQLGAWQISVESSQPSGRRPAPAESRAQAETPTTVVARSGGHRVVLAGDATAAIAADLRSVNRGNASRPPSPPGVAVLEATQSVGAPSSAETPDLGAALVYRTTENGDVTVQLSDAGLQVQVARGPHLGIAGAK
ncbi:MAG TPA: ComEC/Rec2 family competence protein, partial [Dehalococcoidia bacterium]|nr:ComEC/Rec2 family competence protein [Dehalococcoidia bacterium]